MDRRALLKALAAAPLAATLSGRAAASSPSRLVVLVYLHGGNDGFNTWVPYTNALYYRLRPNIAVPRDAVIKISEEHGFHPALAALMPAWKAGDLALLQGVGYPLVTQQHYRDTEIAFTGIDGDIRAEGWVSRALARKAVAPCMAFDMLDIRESDPMGPYRGEKLPAVQVHHARELLMKHRVQDCAVVTNGPGERTLASLPRVGTPLRTTFPDDPFGEAMRGTVELAAADRDVPVIHVTINGLDGDKHHSVDCHWKQLDFHGEALRRLAEGLAALRSGLQEIGRWDETLVATYDEFGRSPVENEDQGTHHGLATTHFMMGGRVKGGVHGAAPPVERVYLVGGPAPSTDMRRIWTTVAERWWGVDASRLFDGRYPSLDLIKA
jgi:uncharacterized protein (DUF1501 family)